MAALCGGRACGYASIDGVGDALARLHGGARIGEAGGLALLRIKRIEFVQRMHQEAALGGGARQARFERRARFHGAAPACPRAGDFRELKELLGDVAEGYDADGRSFMAQRLLSLGGPLPAADMEAYDDNIKCHLDRINAARTISCL